MGGGGGLPSDRREPAERLFVQDGEDAGRLVDPIAAEVSQKRGADVVAVAAVTALGRRSQPYGQLRGAAS
jgi:hypothetical protein